MKSKVLKQVENMIKDSKEKMERLREQEKIEKYGTSQKRIETDSVTQKSISVTISKQAENEIMRDIKRQLKAKVKEQKNTLSTANEYL
jgi:hypothetical protein